MSIITPFDFFTVLYPQGHPQEALPPGQLMLWSRIRRSGKTVTDWCCSVHQAARRVETFRRTRDLFFGVALQDPRAALARARRRHKRATPSRIRGGADSVTVLPALWAEIVCDPGGAAAAAVRGPAGRPLPPDRSAALALLGAVPRPPSLVVWTGTAFQVYWLLEKPWVLEDEDRRRRAARLLGNVQWALASSAAAEGWCLDGRLAGDAGSAGGLAGLMRVPGTFRQLPRQTAVGRPAVVPITVEEPAAGEPRRWATADFEGLEEAPEPQTSEPPWALGVGAPRRPAPPAPADFGKVWRGCSWLRRCYHDQAVLPERDWRAALSIVGRSRVPAAAIEGAPGLETGAAGGRSLARLFSARHPGYVPGRVDEELTRALTGEGGPVTCERVARGLGAWEEHCSRCPNRGRIESPIDLGGAGDGAPPPEVLRPVPATDSGQPLEAPPAPPVLRLELVLRQAPERPGTGRAPSLLQLADATGPVLGEGPRPGSGMPERGTPADARIDGKPAGAAAAALFASLEELLAALGGRATARQMVAALTAAENGGRFALLRAALGALLPQVGNGLPTVRQLGYVLRSRRRHTAGGRSLVATGRSAGGVRWAIRPPAAS